MPKTQLSVCMIVKNEEAFIAECLKSVQSIADQIVVVDTGSTDNTIEIAKQFGAEVHPFKWVDDFSAARNASIKYARGEWIFWLDADERLLPESVTALKSLLRPERKAVAYRVHIKNIMADGKNFKISTGHRLFNNFKGIRFEGRIHEQIIYSIARHNGEERNSDIFLYHLGYGLDEKAQQQKNERNRRLLLQLVREQPANAYAHFTLGQNYLLSNDPKNALKHYLKALKLKGLDRPLRINVMNTTAETYLKLGRLDLAREYAQKSLQQVPEQISAYYLMYRIAMQAKEPQEAIRWLEKLNVMNHQSKPSQKQIATDIKLNETDILVTLSDLYAQMGQMDEAEKTLQQAMEKDEQNAALFKRLLNFYLQTQQWSKALNLIDQQANQNDSELLDVKALVQIKQRNFLAAIETYAQLLSLQPSNLEIVKRLAGLFLKIGQREKANQLLRTIQEIEQAKGLV